MTIPPGFRAESEGNERVIPLDSALSQPASQPASHFLASSRNDALARGRETETATTARIRNLDQLDATTKDITTLRPDWSIDAVRAVLARDRRGWHDVVAAALRAALDPNVRTPAWIENHDARDYAPTPVPMSFEELNKRPRCVNGAVHDPHPCALCRAGAHIVVPDAGVVAMGALGLCAGIVAVVEREVGA